MWTSKLLASPVVKTASLSPDGWILDRNKFETEETSLTVEAALKETVSWGWVRGFKVHPRYTVGSNIFYDFPNVDDYVAL